LKNTLAIGLLAATLSILAYSWLKTGSGQGNSAALGSFDARFFGNVPALCEGECTTLQTDVIVDIDGGTPPYKITVEVNWNPALPNNFTTYTKNDANSIHAFRICHDNSIPGIGVSPIADDITIINVPSNFFPGELVIVSIEDAAGCFANFTQSDPITLTSGQGVYIDYLTTIPPLVCDSLVLPDIDPFEPGAAYFSEPAGAGLQFAPGEVLDINSINLPNDLLDSLYIFNPNDECESEKLYTFMIQPSPKHDLPNDTILCGEYLLPGFSGAVTTPKAQYATSRYFENSSLLIPGFPILTSQTIYVADTASYIFGECTFLDSFTVSITTAPFAGRDTTVFICEGETTIIADPLELLPGAETGGTWSGTQIPDLDYNNPIDIDLSHMTAGLRYILIYTIEKQGCMITTAEIVLEAISAPFAGDSTSISICNADPPQDLFALINNPDMGGSWSQTEGPSIFINNGVIDFSSALNWQYAFVYTLPATNSCPSRTAELRINLGAGTNAGLDNTAVVCKGDSLDMFSLLSTDADQNGVFSVDGLLPLPNGLWDSNQILLDEGEVNIQYVIEASSTSCGADTSDFVISLIKEPNAGNPLMMTTEICDFHLYQG